MNDQLSIPIDDDGELTPEQAMYALYQAIARIRPIHWYAEQASIELPMVWDDEAKAQVPMPWPVGAQWPAEGGAYVVFCTRILLNRRHLVPMRCFERQQDAVRWALTEQGVELP